MYTQSFFHIHYVLLNRQQNFFHFVHLNYKDHHEFSTSELELIHSKPLVVTTEKDFSRLNSEVKDQLYYLPIQLKIDRVSEFDRLVGEYVKQF